MATERYVEPSEPHGQRGCLNEYHLKPDARIVPEEVFLDTGYRKERLEKKNDALKAEWSYVYEYVSPKSYMYS